MDTQNYDEEPPQEFVEPTPTSFIAVYDFSNEL